MTRVAVLVFTLLAGCAPDAVPRTITVRADSTLGPVLTAVMPEVEATRRGLTVRLDTSVAGTADVMLTIDAAPSTEIGSVALARANLVVVGPPGAQPAPTLESAIESARSIGVAQSGTVARLSAQLLATVTPGIAARVVAFPTTQAALDSVAARATDIVLALAPAALASNAYAVIYRPSQTESAAAVVTGIMAADASADAKAVLTALAAPTAYRAWAAAGFRPPP